MWEAWPALWVEEMFRIGCVRMAPCLEFPRKLWAAQTISLAEGTMRRRGASWELVFKWLLLVEYLILFFFFPFSYVRVLYVSMCESTCVGMCTCVCKFMQRPKVGVDNHPPLLVLELAAIDQLMGVRQPAPCCGALQGLKTHS